MFVKTSFIKADIPFVPSDKQNCYAPMFRRVFNVDNSFSKAEIAVCGLGIAYYYLNGRLISPDLFTAAESDYNKTLWYNVYDVTALLQKGQNVLAVICGNGYYNEIFKTPWDYDAAPWRDHPKFILELAVDGKTILRSDDSWRCNTASPVTYNQLRSGEHFDARLYDPAWTSKDFNDHDWPNAICDNTPPSGTFRYCDCEPIRECGEYKAQKMIEVDDGVIFDIGQNISGYVRIRVNQQAGDLISIRYAEQLNDDNTLNFNNMLRFYPDSVFACDQLICPNGPFTWSPRFAYHGFRYIKVSGLKNPSLDAVSGIFVHQDVAVRSEFNCSDELVNRLFKIGQMAVLSNLFWKPTDCPTREKLGWANDAQASCEQMLLNFDTSKLFRKWLQDVQDAMREDGALPGIIPTSGWGFNWGNGPVSEGILFEIPYRLFLTDNDTQPLIDSYPAMKRSLDWFRSQKNDQGLIEYGLCDWAAPNPTKVPLGFINEVLLIKCLKIARLAAGKAGLDADVKALDAELASQEQDFAKRFMLPDGRCAVNEQSAVAMVIYHGLYKDLAPLKAQLAELVEAAEFRHNCGMVGLRHLFDALTICGLPDYAYRVITAKGYPSFSKWLDGGATTLWEMWDCHASKNHHMYSDFMGWLVRTLGGINIDRGDIVIRPHFIPQLTSCRSSRKCAHGSVTVQWQRGDKNSIELTISVPPKTAVSYDGKALPAGRHQFTIKNQA
ncbi:MAG: family 78 glycoside hydrolase catalytic domain [Lentisphaeria bacterium]|jgi:alpha-L-rhamnosidase